jgi:hypothetical protein
MAHGHAPARTTHRRSHHPFYSFEYFRAKLGCKTTRSLPTVGAHALYTSKQVKLAWGCFYGHGTPDVVLEFRSNQAADAYLSRHHEITYRVPNAPWAVVSATHTRIAQARRALRPTK